MWWIILKILIWAALILALSTAAGLILAAVIHGSDYPDVEVDEDNDWSGRG
jgi:hypothetical protein